MRITEEVTIIEKVLSGRIYKNQGHIEIDFFGETESYWCSRDNIHDVFTRELKRRQDAYELIPKDAHIIPKQDIKKFKGILVAGITINSLRKIIGVVGSGSIENYRFIIYWALSQKEVDHLLYKEE